MILSDARSVLSVDVRGVVDLWDIVMARHVKRYGAVPYDEVCSSMSSRSVVLPKWFSIDVRLGVLSVTLRARNASRSDLFLRTAGRSLVSRVNLQEVMISNINNGNNNDTLVD